MKEIIINSKTHGSFTVRVDDDDFERVSAVRWYVSKKKKLYYVQGRPNGGKIPTTLQQFILGKREGYLIDHVNFNTFDNQKNNLRYATLSESNAHRKSNKIESTSNYQGVHLCKITNKYVASIKKDKKKTQIGYFKSDIDAAQAYNFMAEKLFGNFAVYN